MRFYLTRISTNRKTIGSRFPFVFFMSIGMFPMAVWISTAEITVTDMGVDGDFSFSFGQVRLWRPFQ